MPAIFRCPAAPPPRPCPRTPSQRNARWPRWGQLLALLALLALVMLQSGCASTLRSEVTSFQRWPADAEGATFDFRTDPKHADDLEYHSYQQRLADELQLQGLQLAPQGQPPRFWLSFDYDSVNQRIRVQEPVYDDRPIWVAPVWVNGRGWRGGYWASDPFGPRIIGSQTIEHDVRRLRLRVHIEDGQRRVYEATALTQAGAEKSISQYMPYLIRAVFANFPGQDGQTRSVEFDTDSGAIRR
jgi:hypothetical protein